MNFTSSQNFNESELIFALMLIILALLAPFIIIGNLFIVLAVYKKHNLRTPTNYILTSLAVNDIVTCVALGLDSYPSAFQHKTWYPCMANLLALPLFTVCAITTLHIVALTVDRYITVIKPLQYPSLVTNRRVGYAIVFIWAVCVILLVIRVYVDLTECKHDGNNDNGGGIQLDTSLGFVAFNWFIVSALILTLFMLIISNLRIMQIAVKQARAIANAISSGQNNRVAPATIEHRLKAVKTTGIIVGVLVSFWTPYLVFFTLRVTTNGDETTMAISNLCFMVAVAIAAAVNPFIYHHRDKEFRTAFLEIFHAVCNRFTC